MGHSFEYFAERTNARDPLSTMLLSAVMMNLEDFGKAAELLMDVLIQIKLSLRFVSEKERVITLAAFQNVRTVCGYALSLMRSMVVLGAYLAFRWASLLTAIFGKDAELLMDVLFQTKLSLRFASAAEQVTTFGCCACMLVRSM